MKRLPPLAIWIFAAVILAMFARLVLVENYIVVDESMSPHYHKGNWVLVTKFDFGLRFPFSTYGFFRYGSPDRGEIVAFTLPYEGAEMYLKRVLAIEGDRVAIQSGKILVNGQIKEAAEHLTNYGPVDIPPEHFFVLGDNLAEHSDSRTWGPIPYSCLKGRALIRILR